MWLISSAFKPSSNAAGWPISLTCNHQSTLFCNQYHAKDWFISKKLSNQLDSEGRTPQYTPLTMFPLINRWFQCRRRSFDVFDWKLRIQNGTGWLDYLHNAPKPFTFWPTFTTVSSKTLLLESFRSLLPGFTMFGLCKPLEAFASWIVKSITNWVGWAYANDLAISLPCVKKQRNPTKSLSVTLTLRLRKTTFTPVSTL